MTKREKLTEFYKSNYNTFVVNYSRRAGTVEDAEDIVQEAFTRALTYLERYNDNEPFSNWMSRVVYNTFCSWKSDKDSMGISNQFNEEYFDPIEGNQQRKQLVANVMGLMKDYPEHHQQIINYYYCCNYTFVEVANLVGVSRLTVNNVLKKFKKEVKDATV